MIVLDGGTVVLIETESTDETEWVLAHVDSSGYQPDFPERIVVERRYAPELIAGMQADGIDLKAGR